MLLAIPKLNGTDNKLLQQQTQLWSNLFNAPENTITRTKYNWSREGFKASKNRGRHFGVRKDERFGLVLFDIFRSGCARRSTSARQRQSSWSSGSASALQPLSFPALGSPASAVPVWAFPVSSLGLLPSSRWWSLQSQGRLGSQWGPVLSPGSTWRGIFLGHRRQLFRLGVHHRIWLFWVSCWGWERKREKVALNCFRKFNFFSKFAEVRIWLQNYFFNCYIKCTRKVTVILYYCKNCLKAVDVDRVTVK